MRKREFKKVVSVFLMVGLLLDGGGRVIKAAESGEDISGVYLAWQDREENKAKKPDTALLREPESQKEEDVQEESGGIKEQKENAFHAAKDYGELLKVLDENRTGIVQWGINHYFTLDSADGIYDGAQSEGAVIPDASVSIELSDKEYSDTNVQVEGIAEADIVKTDGKYIYILSKDGGTSKVFIVRAENGALFLETSFSPEDTFTVWQEEMYVSGNRLALVRHGAKLPEQKQTGDELYYDWWFGYHGERQTQVLIYDIEDKKAPMLMAEHVQDGDYVSSRERNGFLYVISEKGIYYNYIRNIDVMSKEEDVGVQEFSEEDLARLPQVDGVALSANCIYFREKNMDSAYTIVTSVCLEKPEQLSDRLSFLADSEHCYMSENAIYLAACDWWDYGQKDCDYTDIVKISYQDGRFYLAAQGKVKGNLDDQFSMDERNGYLRVVTTVDHYQLEGKKDDIWQRYVGRSNSLYVLDVDLKLVGSLENLAEDERIYSARFLGDIAYFVTFRDTDPLFSVDVSDPEHPVLLGALKIPGFSDYLHPYGENLLLGIGYDANNIKLTMFDISNPREVVEKHTLLLKDYDTSEACSNHRAVLIDEKNCLIGLPLEGSSYGDRFQNYMETKAYAVYGYNEETGFYQKFEKKYIREWDGRYYYGIELIPKQEISVPDNSLWENFDVETGGENAEADNLVYDWNDWYNVRLRGVYIGNYFYIINPVQEVLSWQMGEEGFLEKGALNLR